MAEAEGLTALHSEAEKLQRVRPAGKLTWMQISMQLISVFTMETSVLNDSCLSRVYLESCRRLAEFALVFVSLKLLSRGG